MKPDLAARLAFGLLYVLAAVLGGLLFMWTRNWVPACICWGLLLLVFYGRKANR